MKRSGNRTVFLIRDSGPVGYPDERRRKERKTRKGKEGLDPPPHTKQVNSKWIIVLNIKCKTINLPEDNRKISS